MYTADEIKQWFGWHSDHCERERLICDQAVAAVTLPTSSEEKRAALTAFNKLVEEKRK